MAKLKPLAEELVEDLLLGNQILFKYGIVDAFGHLSVRHDKDPEKYVMSRHLAPALVTEKDLLTYDLDSNPIAPTKHRLYSERFIHGEIYKVRPDVMSVVHVRRWPHMLHRVRHHDSKPNGADRSTYHVSAFLGDGVRSKFDIRIESRYDEHAGGARRCGCTIQRWRSTTPWNRSAASADRA